MKFIKKENLKLQIFIHTLLCKSQSRKRLKIFNKQRKNDKKVILYASHRLADATHMLGVSYSFQDYYDQFKETLTCL